MKRIQAFAIFLWLAIAALAAADPAVISIGTTVADLDRSIEFYTNVLGFEVVSQDEVWGEQYERLSGVFGMRARLAELRIGEESFVLTEYLTPRGRPVPLDSKSNDLWFQHIAIVVSDIDAAYARLRRNGVRHVSTGPQTLPDWNPNAGGIRAFYFQDPDGHNLEVIWYPKGKGDPRWQPARAGTAQPLFLGIDHTAIVVADTEHSLGFYRDLLGLKVAGSSENWGTEQEHLNLVSGARLRITALRGAGGPGIEFLEYVRPAGGRATPADLAANDLAHWQVVVAGRDPVAVLDRLDEYGGRAVSSGVVELNDDPSGRGKATILRGPDGHAVVLVTP